MSKISNMLNMVQILKDENVHSIQSLAQKLEVSERMIIIGDELEKDILGGIKNKIDTCWFNPNKICNSQYKTTYEIHKLTELKNIL